MFEREYQEMIQDLNLNDKTEAVLGVQSAYIAAIFGAIGFFGIILLLGIQHLFIHIDNMAVALGIVAIAITCLVFGLIAGYLNKFYNFDSIKENIKNGHRYWD